jgi:uncharacterized membrane protein YidH (DUF202 family)
MALATRPKPKTYHKKRRAQHHRQSKPYLKTYWPYLPMLAIVAAGYEVNKAWPNFTADPGFATVNLTRIQAVTGDKADLSLAIVCTVAALAAAAFTFTHWYRFHRVLNRGEAFIVHHPWLDVGLVFVITAGFILTRAQ